MAGWSTYTPDGLYTLGQPHGAPDGYFGLSGCNGTGQIATQCTNRLSNRLEERAGRQAGAEWNGQKFEEEGMREQRRGEAGVKAMQQERERRRLLQGGAGSWSPNLLHFRVPFQHHADVCVHAGSLALAHRCEHLRWDRAAGCRGRSIRWRCSRQQLRWILPAPIRSGGGHPFGSLAAAVRRKPGQQIPQVRACVTTACSIDGWPSGRNATAGFSPQPTRTQMSDCPGSRCPSSCGQALSVH